MAQEKYPISCPWDFGPGQKQSHKDEWILVNGDESVKFARDPSDKYWFNLIYNGGVHERILLFRARLTYQKLLDKGYKLEEA